MFPASTRAAVHGMRMKIGERVIEAKIERKQAARAELRGGAPRGKRASLLEQERPNVFTMNVANIMPGDRIAVELDYTELLVPDEATYEFVYPTVVGPRYAGGADPGKDTVDGEPAPAGRHARAVPVRHQGPPRDRHRAQGAVVAVAPDRGDVRGPGARRRAAGDRRAAATATSCCATGWRATRSRAASCCGRARAAAAARELLRADDGAAAAADGGADPAPRVHLPPRRLGLDARLPARHREGADARPARRSCARPTASTSCCSRAPRTCAARRDRSRRARTRSPPRSPTSSACTRAAAPS